MTDTAVHSTELPLGAADAVLNALPLPVIILASDGRIADANVAAESFFEASVLVLRRQDAQRDVIRNLSEAMEQSHSAIMIADLEGRIDYVNRGL